MLCHTYNECFIGLCRSMMTWSTRNTGHCLYTGWCLHGRSLFRGSHTFGVATWSRSTTAQGTLAAGSWFSAEKRWSWKHEFLTFWVTIKSIAVPILGHPWKLPSRILECGRLLKGTLNIKSTGTALKRKQRIKKEVIQKSHCSHCI